MKKLVIATKNPGKLREIAARLTGLAVEVIGLTEAAPRLTTIEDSPTFEGNARIKARASRLATGLPSLADDSGLEVDALGGAPGVLSARFAGEGATDEVNNALLLERLAGVLDRRARYRCVLVLSAAAAEDIVIEATCEGSIAEAPRGRGGFGYDPLFVVGDRRLSELPLDEKNRISHRGRALDGMMPHLVELFGSRSCGML